MSDETKKQIEEAERFIRTQPPHVKARQTIKLMESLLAALRDAEAREGKLYAQLRDAESLWAETFVENQLLEMAEIRAILDPEKPERMMLSELVGEVKRLVEQRHLAKHYADVHEALAMKVYPDRSGKTDILFLGDACDELIRLRAALAAGKDKP